MILINLLPPEFRKEKRKSLPLSSSTKSILLLGGILFLGLTFIFYTHYLLSTKTLADLKKRWLLLQKEVQRINAIRDSTEKGPKQEIQFLENYVTAPLPAAKILLAASVHLPETLWLVELKLSRKPEANTLLLKGLALPLREGSSILKIEEYLRLLKEEFPKNTSLVLTTSRNVKDGMQLTLFTAVFKWQ